jgi:hypothetical protein
VTKLLWLITKNETFDELAPHSAPADRMNQRTEQDKETDKVSEMALDMYKIASGKSFWNDDTKLDREST